MEQTNGLTDDMIYTEKYVTLESNLQMVYSRIYNELKINWLKYMSDSIVIIPTYNEKENIENIIRAVFGLEKVFHILVIDDGSPDGTAAIVKGLQKEFPERLFYRGA